MPKRTQQNQQNKNKPQNWEGFYSRSSAFGERASSVNVDKRTVEAVLATENPVQVVDWSRWEMIDEILLMDGYQAPAGRQVPMLDNHSRYETSDVIGSVREIRREGAQLIGTLVFSSLERADKAWTLVREGHLTDVSAGYRVMAEESVFVNPGEETIINGRSFKNDGTRTLVIRKKWSLKEVSTTPIGADEASKMRSEIEPESLGQQIEQSTTDNSQSKGGIMPEEIRKEDTPAKPVIDQNEVKRLAKEMLERTIKNKETVNKRGELMDLTAEEIRECIAGIDFSTEDSERLAMEKLTDKADAKRKAIPPKSSDPAIKTDEIDNFRSAAVASMSELGGLPVDEKSSENLKKSVYRGMGIQATMRAYLQLKGVRNAAWLSPEDLYHKTRAIAAQGSGDFANVFLDVANKALSRGWTEAPTTYQAIAGSDTINNFMTKNVVKVTLMGDASKILEGEGFPFASRTDAKETASLYTIGLAYSLSRQAIINDDLSALTDAPARLNESIRRYIDRAFWVKLYGTNMAGPTMGEDSTAMFTSGHSNLVGVGSGAAPTVTTLATGRRAMRKQTLPQPDGGRSETQYTNYVPSHIVFHGNLDQTVEQLITSMTDTATAGDLKPNLEFVRRLTPVTSPILDELMDAYNTNVGHNGWYLFADPRRYPAITVYSLTGQSSPTARNKVSDVAEPLGTTWDVYMDVGIAPTEWRSAYANFGK